jgi:hypothetical protein
VWEQWPGWLTELVRTVITVGIAYGIGHVVRLLMSARLARLHSRRPGDWAEVILSEIRPRIGLWSVLVGVHFALRRWPLDAAQHNANHSDGFELLDIVPGALSRRCERGSGD